MRQGGVCRLWRIQRGNTAWGLQSRLSLSLLFFIVHFILNAHADCEEWCIHPCEELNGSPYEECSSCKGEQFACRFDLAAPMRIHVGLAGSDSTEQSLGYVAISESASLAAREQLACQRVSADEIRRLSTYERADLLSRPTIVTDLMSNWQALRNWSDPESFSLQFGEQGILAKRIGPVFERLGAVGRDAKSTLVRVRDVLPMSNRLHAVLYHGEPGNAIAEEDFLSMLDANEGTMWHCPHGILSRACGTTVLSLGGGREGVRMANHGLAWIGLVAGMKVWHVRAYNLSKPISPTCVSREDIEELPGVTHCLQRAGEVMIVPTAWWHATCNLANFTLGIGGQDSCDLVDCTPQGPQGETPSQLHLRKQFCRNETRAVACHGKAGDDAASRVRLRKQGLHGRPRKFTLEHEEWLHQLP